MPQSPVKSRYSVFKDFPGETTKIKKPCCTARVARLSKINRAKYSFKIHFSNLFHSKFIHENHES
jgi:hypothetical protein